MNNMRTWTPVQITILSELTNFYYPFLTGQAHASTTKPLISNPTGNTDVSARNAYGAGMDNC